MNQLEPGQLKQLTANNVEKLNQSHAKKRASI
ncbi:hypothetical protein CPS_3060 [Colwellia psychrerythraea 34H]|uniref:Uncharacterized protein n=1 Tax=Colwellia psychrerythraea (strain 34H / ATCC BAA-681) TaxID=167879 RepID=Q47ZL2_COLP3|nr:hypothetical protein CPS_3060 [Colwellia psychrerythraea 34H]